MNKYIRKCEMHISKEDTVCICGKPAKFKTPKGLLGDSSIFVCGIHRRIIDKTHEVNGSSKRCTTI